VASPNEESAAALSSSETNANDHGDPAASSNEARATAASSNEKEANDQGSLAIGQLASTEREPQGQVEPPSSGLTIRIVSKLAHVARDTAAALLGSTGGQATNGGTGKPAPNPPAPEMEVGNTAPSEASRLALSPSETIKPKEAQVRIFKPRIALASTQRAGIAQINDNQLSGDLGTVGGVLVATLCQPAT
jgi:hypothetical protein